MAVRYGQFCPVAKAMEILGEKWTLQVIRELLSGATRYNELQRGLRLISPTILTKRLNYLQEVGLVERRKIPGQQGHEYFLTEAGLELMPVVEHIGVWGMRWARGTMPDSELDVEVLLMDIQRRLPTEKFVGRETVLRFQFTDLDIANRWWMVVTPDDVDLCDRDPGREVDVYLTSDLRTLVEVWLGDTSVKEAAGSERLKLVGRPALVQRASDWLTGFRFAGIPRAI